MDYCELANVKRYIYFLKLSAVGGFSRISYHGIVIFSKLMSSKDNFLRKICYTCKATVIDDKVLNPDHFRMHDVYSSILRHYALEEKSAFMHPQFTLFSYCD